jgi:hypothetical protein
MSNQQPQHRHHHHDNIRGLRTTSSSSTDPAAWPSSMIRPLTPKAPYEAAASESGQAAHHTNLHSMKGVISAMSQCSVARGGVSCSQQLAIRAGAPSEC